MSLLRALQSNPPAVGRRDCVCPEPKPGAPRWSTMDLTLCWARHARVCCVCVPLAMVFGKKIPVTNTKL